jgi:hypothetical protein
MQLLGGKHLLMGQTAGRWVAQAEDQGDSVTFMFESATQERVSDFELKLMDIDSEQCAPLCCCRLPCGSTAHTTPALSLCFTRAVHQSLLHATARSQRMHGTGSASQTQSTSAPCRCPRRNLRASAGAAAVRPRMPLPQRRPCSGPCDPAVCAGTSACMLQLLPGLTSVLAPWQRPGHHRGHGADSGDQGRHPLLHQRRHRLRQHLPEV